MALTPQESNFVSDAISISRELLDLRNRIQLMQGRWNQNGHFYNEETQTGGISSLKLSDVDGAKHLTSGELTEFINAIGAINTALGDLVNGQAVNLLKMLP